MKRVYLGNKELTTIATVTNGGGGGGDDTQKWVDYFNGNLIEFTVPEGVTNINKYSFSTCTSLKSINLPDTLINIGEYAFYGCSSLTSITIPDGVTRIVGSTFYCENLTSASIGNGVKNIDYWGFIGCKKLTTVTIGTNIASISDHAFQNCPSINYLTIKATTPTSLGGSSAIPSSVSTIYVPSASVDTYKAANGWKNYADKIQAIPS